MVMTIRALLPLCLWMAVSEASTPLIRGVDERRLSLQRIVGYEPRTQVTDQAAIDLDQKVMEEELFLGQMAKALNVYVEGGHSGSYAQLTLLAPSGPVSFNAGDTVTGSTLTGGEVTGTLMEPLNIGEGNTQDIQIRVQYTTSDIQAKYVGCQVGGLYTFFEANRAGCFTDSGTVVVVQKNQLSSQSKRFNYKYNPRLDNNNARTLQTFSTTAHNVMHPLGDMNAPYIPDYQVFLDYYGNTEYANMWVMAANGGKDVTFSSGRGGANFTKLNFLQAYAEAMSKGTVVLNSYMYIIHTMEDAVAYCEKKCAACANEQIHALDAAVAFYAGSLEGEDGNTGNGVMLYNLADTRGVQFSTAGPLANDDQGTSYTNIMIIQMFNKMQIYLLQGDCASARQGKDFIANFMKVPIVQSVLRYAYMRAYQNPSVPEDSQQVMAEGATYTAALLPYLYNCSQDDAASVYNYMKIGSIPEELNFPAVKAALERNYQCMGITCSQVGGLWTVNGYSANAAPCQDGSSISNTQVSAATSQAAPPSSTSTASHNGGLVAGSIIGILAGCAFLFLAYRSMKSRRYYYKDSHRRTSNIAAVAEIS